MKISQLVFKNIYGIEERSLKPGQITVFEGGNGRGKTSVLDAIQTTFTNKGYRSRVVKNGEEEAELFIELDEGIKIDKKRRTEKSDYTKVMKGDEVIKGPEQFLRSLFSDEQFNPIKDFIEKSKREQNKTLLSICFVPWSDEDYIKNFGEIPKDVDPSLHILQNLEKIQSKSGTYYLSREETNRERRNKEAIRDEIKEKLPDNYNADEWRQINLSELYEKVTKAQDHNQKLDNCMVIISNLEDKILGIEGNYTKKASDTKELYEFKKKKKDDEIQECKNTIENEKKLISKNEQATIDECKSLDKELEEEIAALRKKYANKKQEVSDSYNLLISNSKKDIEGLNIQIAEKQQELKNMDNLQAKDIEALENEKIKEIKHRKEIAGSAEEFIAENEKKDIEPLKLKAETAEKMKNFIHEADRVTEYEKEITRLCEISNQYTQKIEKARELPGILLQEAKMPIDNLTVENGEVLINGLPLDNLSEGEQYQVALEVAKHKTGPLKVILIDGFEKFDKKHRDLFIRQAKETDLQYFITRVTDSELQVIEM